MSVQIKSSKNKELLTLTLDNGDKEIFNNCLNKWNFKDEQSMLRFIFSIMKESDDKKTIGIIKNGTLSPYAPAGHLLQEN